MGRFLVVFVVLTLVGCTTNAKTHVVRGVSGVEIDCSGLGSGWERCYARADSECRADGYKVVARSSDAREEDQDYPFGWNPAGYLTRTMLVICR
ncbi:MULTISPECIES: hypothetical protein [unclassified Pseudomonas]|uniref:hypothetical protein n=1 Tax=unclassified Pseudomonas TaxID=196821 RepID=UPI000B866029|nr:MULTISPECIES: hypothetical protein [unclassified Pseudomonas]